MAKHNDIGKIGEDIATKWFTQNGYTIVGRNYRKKYGEIDIVARETNSIHFIEVKSVSYETKSDLERSVSHGTWRPEENVHTQKQKRLKRVIETWIIENNYNGMWQIDIVTVRIVLKDRIARVNLIKNVIFE